MEGVVNTDSIKRFACFARHAEVKLCHLKFIYDTSVLTRITRQHHWKNYAFTCTLSGRITRSHSFKLSAQYMYYWAGYQRTYRWELWEARTWGIRGATKLEMDNHGSCLWHGITQKMEHNIKKITSIRWILEARLRRTKANSPICARDMPTYGGKTRLMWFYEQWQMWVHSERYE